MIPQLCRNKLPLGGVRVGCNSVDPALAAPSSPAAVVTCNVETAYFLLLLPSSQTRFCITLAENMHFQFEHE